MNLQTISFESYRIWFRLVGLPFLQRNEADICYLLHGYLLVNDIKPKKHQVIPLKGFKVQTTLFVSKRVPTCINVKEDDYTMFVGFNFFKLPLSSAKGVKSLVTSLKLVRTVWIVVTILPWQSPPPPLLSATTHCLPLRDDQAQVSSRHPSPQLLKLNHVPPPFEPSLPSQQVPRNSPNHL